MARLFATKTTLLAALTAIATVLLGGCATVVQDQKRALLDRKCQERVIRMLNAGFTGGRRVEHPAEVLRLPD